MIRAVVNVPGTGHVIGLARRLISRLSTGDARVDLSVVMQHLRQWVF
jgi:hypothetical protein